MKNKIYWTLLLLLILYLPLSVSPQQSGSSSPRTPTTVIKSGSGGGDYTTTSGSYVAMDGTNLSYTVTIPTGWKLLCWSTGSWYNVSGTTQTTNFSFFDSHGSTFFGAQSYSLLTGPGLPSAFSIFGSITGDGNSHTISLRWENPFSGGAFVPNNTGTSLPEMMFLLTPSN